MATVSPSVPPLGLTTMGENKIVSVVRTAASGDNSSMATRPTQPDLYDYLEIAQFLEDVFAFRKATEAGFSYSVWASELGLSNKTVLRFILKKERRISTKSVNLFVRNLKLSPADATYFEVLVSYSQAKSKTDKQSFGASLIKLQRHRYQPLEIEPNKELQSAISPVVLSLLAFKDVLGSVAELSGLLQLEDSVVADALNELEAQGIVQKDAIGLFKFDQAGFKIPDRPGDIKLRHYHEYWLGRAKLAISLDPKIRKFRALKFALNEEEFLSVLERINEFAISILSNYNPKNLENRRLYMLETLLFPVANVDQNRLEEAFPAENEIGLNAR